MSDHGKTPRPPRDEPDIRVVMMPRDTNAEGSIFGGVILSYIDQAAYVEAKRQMPYRYVVFKEPVQVGDVLSLYGKTARIGRTSITISVRVMAERFRQPTDIASVTEAEVVMVAIDDNCRPREIVIE